MASLYGPEMLTLPTGRRIAFEQFGHPKGQPVVFFHGMPFSRLITPATSPAWGIRVISLDRPGYGLSDVQSSRTLLDYCNDIRSVAEHLKLDRVAAVGVSAGGAYALACARGLANLVTRAVVVAGVAHPEAAAARGPGGTPPAFSRAIETGDYSPVLKTFELYRSAALANSHGFFERLTASLPPVDQEILAAHAEHVLSGMVDAIYKTAEGWASDEVLTRAPWGFRLQEIAAPVSLFHGEDDSIVTLPVAAYQASLIPGCRTTYYPEEGHWFFLERWEEILLEAVSHKEMVH